MALELLMAICAPFAAEELAGDIDAACARRMNEWKAYVSSSRMREIRTYGLKWGEVASAKPRRGSLRDK